MKLGDTVIDRGGGVPLARAWNTWANDRPAAMVFLPLGVHVTPFGFAASVERATLFPLTRAMRLGTHAIDAATVELELEHARLTLRSKHGMAVDRGRLVREAVAIVLADLESNGEGSALVRRLADG